MARFVPDTHPDEVAHDSERVVYEALKALPPGYVVLHSFPWLRPNRDLVDEPLREGEADFLVLHPDRGLLVLEVKGGAPSLRGRSWVRGGREMRDPFEQARRNRYALLDAVEERTAGRIHRGQFTHGDVVVFPHVQCDGSLPLNTDSRILLDASTLADLPAKIEGAFRAWTRNRTGLAPAQFYELLEALMPKLRLLRCAGAEIAAEGRRIVQITLDQRATLLGLLANERVLVEGTAGSGKTLLALEFALTLASRGQRVLFLCFNRALAAWLQEQASDDGRVERAHSELDIATFHSFALTLARRARVEFEIPTHDAQPFWDDEVPLILEQALDVLRSSGGASAYDAIVIDEAQDFSPDWWVTVESLSREGRNGRLYAFLDLLQSIRQTPALPPVSLPTRFHLATNCRNTQAIARSAAALIQVEVTILPGSPQGEPPGLRRAPSEAADAGIVLGELRQLLQSGVEGRQIAVIGPASLAHGPLSRHRDVDGTPFIDDPGDWRRGGGILVTTARTFKGLEADVVILHNLTGFSPLFRTTDLYVAWTRARHRLIVVCYGSAMRAEVEAALAVAESPLTPRDSDPSS